MRQYQILQAREENEKRIWAYTLYSSKFRCDKNIFKEVSVLIPPRVECEKSDEPSMSEHMQLFIVLYSV